MARTITTKAICGVLTVACAGVVAGGVGTRGVAIKAQSSAEENEALAGC